MLYCYVKAIPTKKTKINLRFFFYALTALGVFFIGNATFPILMYQLKSFQFSRGALISPVESSYGGYNDYNGYNSYNNYKIYIGNPERAANAMIYLINQTNQLLDQKLRWLEEKFIKEGGFRENLFKKRQKYRRSKRK